MKAREGMAGFLSDGVFKKTPGSESQWSLPQSSDKIGYQMIGLNRIFIILRYTYAYALIILIGVYGLPGDDGRMTFMQQLKSNEVVTCSLLLQKILSYFLS